MLSFWLTGFQYPFRLGVGNEEGIAFWSMRVVAIYALSVAKMAAKQPLTAHVFVPSRVWYDAVRCFLLTGMCGPSDLSGLQEQPDVAEAKLWYAQ